MNVKAVGIRRGNGAGEEREEGEEPFCFPVIIILYIEILIFWSEL